MSRCFVGVLLKFFTLIEYRSRYSAHYHTHYYHRGLAQFFAVADKVSHDADYYTDDEGYNGYLKVGRDKDERKSSEYRGNNVGRHGRERGDYLRLEDNQRDKTDYNNQRRDDTAYRYAYGGYYFLFFAALFRFADVLGVKSAWQF